jgi:hypothetical protein
MGNQEIWIMEICKKKLPLIWARRGSKSVLLISFLYAVLAPGQWVHF